MSTISKVIRISQHGGPEVLEYVDQEVLQPSADEIQIEQKAIGLNFIDIYFRIGLYKHPLPHGLGFEGSGSVRAIGANITHVKPGDRVAYGQSPLGAYAQIRNVLGSRVVKLPDSISFEEAAGIMLKGLTAQYLLRQTYCVQSGDMILIHAAAGGVGLIACQWAAALGARVIGTASTKDKMALALANGAWAMINYTKENVAQRVYELTKGKKLPVVYDGVGKDTWETSLDCLRPRGLMVSYGNASGAVTGVDLGILNTKGSLYVTRPSLGAYVPTQESMQAAADDLFAMVTSGKVKIHIGQRYPLDQVAKAQVELAARKTTGATILLV